MSFRADNREYEIWLRSHCDVVEADLDYKHERMTKNAFVFLRATFFRWANRIEKICPDLAQAPTILSVGDAHVENYGTWRDAEGRLVWGINDFDEAADIPYPFDLVRLATSAGLAPGNCLGVQKITTAILNGYRDGLVAPRPTLLDEQELWMRPFVACSDDDRVKFWKNIDDCPEEVLPTPAARGLKQSLPRDAAILRMAARFKQGGGGLGRPRFIAVAAWRGGRIVREAKASVPSAWYWAHGRVPSRSWLLDAAYGAYRSADPHLDVQEGFVLRRLAADSRKVDFGDDRSISIKLLTAMGFDLGSIHAADRRGAAVRADLANHPADWLRTSAMAAMAAVEADYTDWKET